MFDPRREIQPPPPHADPELKEQLERSITLEQITNLLLGLNAACARAHQLNYKNFYLDINTGKPKDRNLGELIALMHSELSEMLEGVRKNTMDSHLPDRKAEEVELADLLIRAFDYAGYRKLDLYGAIIQKLRYNCTRADHKPENRRKADGKKF